MENALPVTAAAEMEKQYSLGRILGIWALAAIPMADPELDHIPRFVARCRLGSAGSGRHPHSAAHLRFDLVVCPFHDHRPAGRGRSPLGDGQAQAAPQHAARSENR